MSKSLEIDYQQYNNLVASGIVDGLKDRVSKIKDAHHSLNTLVNTGSIEGKAAQNMKAYTSEVLIGGIGKELIQLIKNFEDVASRISASYPNGVDDQGDFHLIGEDYDSLNDKDKNEQKKAAHYLTDINNKINRLSDLGVDTSKAPTESDSDAVYNHLIKLINTQDQKWRTYESEQTANLKEIEQGVDMIDNLISRYIDGKTMDLASYRKGGFRKIIAKNAKTKAYFDYINKLTDSQLKKDVGANQKIYDHFEKVKSERINNRFSGVLGLALDGAGVFMIMSAAAAAALTGPVALALLAAAPGLIFSASNMTADVDQIVNGKSSGHNPIKDDLFKGNELAYDTVDIVSGAGLSHPVFNAVKDSWAAYKTEKDLAQVATYRSAKSINNSRATLSNISRAANSVRVQGIKGFMHYSKPVVKAFGKQTAKNSIKKAYGEATNYVIDQSFNIINRHINNNSDDKATRSVVKKGAGLAEKRLFKTTLGW